MMSKATMTLIGLYNYDNTLFDKLTMPQGIDKDLLVNNILLRGGEFEVLYSNPVFLQNMFSVWSRKWERTFSKWHEALNLDYNPLDNFDRKEEWTDTGKSKITDKNKTVNAGSDTIESEVSAYDTSSYSPSNKNTTTLGTNTTIDDTTTGDNESTHVGRMHGNIGVTTSMQLIESELSLDEWNLYEHITDIFLKEFVIAVY